MLGEQKDEIRLARKKPGEGGNVSFDTAMLIDGTKLKRKAYHDISVNIQYGGLLI